MVILLIAAIFLVEGIQLLMMWPITRTGFLLTFWCFPSLISYSILRIKGTWKFGSSKEYSGTGTRSRQSLSSSFSLSTMISLIWFCHSLFQRTWLRYKALRSVALVLSGRSEKSRFTFSQVKFALKADLILLLSSLWNDSPSSRRIFFGREIIFSNWNSNDQFVLQSSFTSIFLSLFCWFIAFQKHCFPLFFIHGLRNSECIHFERYGCEMIFYLLH